MAKLNLSLYGTRDAAKNWSQTYTAFLNQIGFTIGLGSTCNFSHQQRLLAMTVHGDDFTAAGSDQDLAWLRAQFEQKFEVKVQILGPGPGQKKEVRVLNRVIRWTDGGLEFEADQRHAEMVVRDLGLENAKAVATPGTREDQALGSVPEVSVAVEIEDDSPLLGAEEATLYRGVAARCNYLAQDRVDIQYSCKECSRRMARPRQGDWAALKRIGRYLKGSPRLIQAFRWQRMPKSVDIFTDSDWAGCRATCRSTSGGVARLGAHVLKSWSSTQVTVALSSAEAELYALTKGAAQALGFITLLADLGAEVKATVHTDATAAIGIARRAGLGKLRHLNVRYLWLQQELQGTEMTLHKVHGLANPADLVTKHLNQQAASKHLELLDMWTEGGRAEAAPKLNSCEVHSEHGAADLPSEASIDGWLVSSGHSCISRAHRKPRTALFTPMKVPGAPPAAELTPARVTKGRFLDSGEEFCYIDCWTRRDGLAHLDLGRRWTGTTEFLRRSSRWPAEGCAIKS